MVDIFLIENKFFSFAQISFNLNIKFKIIVIYVQILITHAKYVLIIVIELENRLEEIDIIEVNQNLIQ